MNLREEILLDHSKAQCEKIVQWVGGSQKRFDELIRLFLTDGYRVVQRAAWPVSYCVACHPRLIKKHFPGLVSYLQQPGIPVAVKRNSMRLLQEVSIPPAQQGAIMDLCFQYITNPREAPAVKAFSLTVLQNLSGIYPEILPEIKLIIEERWDTETPAFRSRARRILSEPGFTG